MTKEKKRTEKREEEREESQRDTKEKEIETMEERGQVDRDESTAGVLVEVDYLRGVLVGLG